MHFFFFDLFIQNYIKSAITHVTLLLVTLHDRGGAVVMSTITALNFTFYDKAIFFKMLCGATLYFHKSWHLWKLLLVIDLFYTVLWHKLLWKCVLFLYFKFWLPRATLRCWPDFSWHHFLSSLVYSDSEWQKPLFNLPSGPTWLSN